MMRIALFAALAMFVAGNAAALEDPALKECNAKDPAWFQCSSDADCSLILDECVNIEAVNKASSVKAVECERRLADKKCIAMRRPVGWSAANYTAKCVAHKCVAQYGK